MRQFCSPPILNEGSPKGGNVEKQLATAAYWLGILSTVVALIMRGLAALGVFVFSSTVGRVAISYRTFLEGAVLFFVMAIAGALITWAKEQKA
jgi:hypothetical protein